MAIEYRQFENPYEALAVCGSLLCFQKRDGTQRFDLTWQTLLSSISKGMYLVQMEEERAIAFLSWIELSAELSQVYAQDLRYITPLENGTGDLTWLSHHAFTLGHPDILFAEWFAKSKNPRKLHWRQSSTSVIKLHREASEYKGIIY